MVGTKTEFHVLDVPQAVNRHSAACEQAERERELGNHERTAQPVPAAARRGAAAFLEHVVQIQVRRLPGRSATEKHARQSGGCQREQQHRRI